jgi:hypothetical protein
MENCRILSHSLAPSHPARPRYTCHAQLQSRYFQQHLSAGFHGGAGGYYIVYQQYVLALEAVAGLQVKYMLHVEPARHAAFAGLGLGVLAAQYGYFLHGQAKHLGHTPGYEGSLVVTPAGQPAAVQRQGHNGIYTCGAAILQQAGTHQAAKLQAYFFISLVLKVMQQVLHGGMLLKKEDAECLVQPDAAGKQACHGVVGMAFKAGIGHLLVAVPAYLRSRVVQGAAAAGAVVGIQELGDAAKRFGKYHKTVVLWR